MAAQTRSHARSLALTLVVASLVAGCSSVAIYKVDRATGRLVDGAAEGARYYLPRPYVSVFEPFIIASDVYIAAGQLTPDSNYVLLTQVPQGLDSIVNSGLQGNKKQEMGPLAIDASTVLVQPQAPAGPQGAAASDAPKTGATPATTSPAPPSTPSDTDKIKTPEDKAAPKDVPVGGGLFNYEVKNDNTAFAVTPQPRFFNILWLPDFDEQYVVMAKPGLGNSTVSLTMGQGWNLQGVNIAVDNSAVVKPLLDFYSGTLGALQKLAVAKIEGPLALLSGAPQGAPVSGAPTAKTEFKGGTPVTVKVTRVRVVAPGLYPILKPIEMATLSVEDQKRILLPKPPLTNIAFNTYDVIVIEAARSTGDSALRIQQYVDSSPPSGSKAPTNSGQAPATSGTTLADAATALNVVLSRSENVTKAGQYYLASITPKDNATAVQLRVRTGASPGTLETLLADAAIKDLVIKTLQGLNITVTTANITIVK